MIVIFNFHQDLRKSHDFISFIQQLSETGSVAIIHILKMNKQAQESKSVETNKCLKKGYPWGDVNELHFSYLENEGIVLDNF